MTLLIGSQTVESVNVDSATTGTIEGCLFTAVATGFVSTMQFRTNGTANTGMTKLTLGIYATSAGVPVTGQAALGQASFTGVPPINSWITVTGLSIPVTAGTAYLLAFIPIGGTLNYTTHAASGGTNVFNPTVAGFSSLSAVTTWSAPVAVGPEAIYGLSIDQAVFPVFLPRRLGPAAVGPTFFSPPNPPPMFGTPAQPGFVAAPAYLPRRLGPAAVGPTFFSPPNPRPMFGTPGAPDVLWLPPTTFPSTRNRSFFVVRGHRVVPVPIADPPIPFVRPRSPRRETARLMRGQRPFPVQPQIPVPPTVPGNRTSSLARRLFALMPRGNGRLPVQPQIAVPPTVPGNRAPAGRRWAFPVRGRRWLPTPPQDPVWPTRIESIRSRLTMLRRGRQVSTVPAQVTVPPTIPGNRWSSARSRFLMLRRGSRPFTPQATTPPVLAWPPPKLGAPRRLLSAPTRPRRTPVPADQHAPLRAAHPRYGLAPRRGHHVTVTPPQIAVPPTRVPRIATRWRWAAVRRGHQTNPVLTQIVVFLTPPCITPPTTAAIMAYFSRAAVSAYTATAKIMAYFSVSSINAYESDGEPFSYAASPAIVSYSSKAAIVIYTSTSRIGPRFCP